MKEEKFREQIDNVVIEKVRREYEFSMPAKHLHNEYEIYYLAKGERSYFINNRTYHITAGTFAFVDSNQIHKTAMVKEAEHTRYLVLISERFFEELEDYYGNVDFRRFFRENSGILEVVGEDRDYIENILECMLTETTDKKKGYELAVKNLLSSILIYAIRNKKEDEIVTLDNQVDSQKHRKVYEITEYIAENYDKDLALERLSAQFFISKYYLCRIFKEVTGFTINEYINMNRVKQAKILLESTKYNMSEVAEKTGYDSLTHFEKVFKSYMAISPLKYRKRLKE